MQPVINEGLYAVFLLSLLAAGAALSLTGFVQPALRWLYRRTLGRVVSRIAARVAYRREIDILGWKDGWSR